MSDNRKRKRINHAYAPAGTYRRQTQKGRASQKTLAIISVFAIILGIMITAQDYLSTHAAAAAAAQDTLKGSLSDAASKIPKYAEAVLSKDASVSSETKKLEDAATAMSSDDFAERNRAYLTVSSVYNSLLESGTAASLDEAGALADALSAVQDAAAAYNEETAALNDKVDAFPYNLIAKTAGYSALPVFDLN